MPKQVHQGRKQPVGAGVQGRRPQGPDLFPVGDNVVCTALGLIGPGKPGGSWRIDWQVYRRLIVDDDIHGAIITAQDGLNARDRSLYGREQDELRVLDTALWTYEIWRIVADKKAAKNAAHARGESAQP